MPGAEEPLRVAKLCVGVADARTAPLLPGLPGDAARPPRGERDGAGAGQRQRGDGDRQGGAVTAMRALQPVQ